jgi:hypothetical protein
MAAISLFWYTNMAAVTSDENDLLETTPPPGSQNLSSRNYFHYSTLLSTQRSYIRQKLDTIAVLRN